MIQGKNIVELATEIERQNGAKRDFLAPSSRLTMVTTVDPALVPRTRMRMKTNGHDEDFALRQLAHEQLGARLGIPRKYYDLMGEKAPELLADNVNHWLHTADDRRLVRTLDGGIRAFLSDRYRPLDNAGLAEAVLPVLGEVPGLRIASAEITERRLYIQAVNERAQGEVKKGDIVQAGILVSNSEVGAGALQIAPLVYRLVCSNGMVMADNALRKYHAGKAFGGGDGREVMEWDKLSDEARQASDKALWLQVRDLTRAALDASLFTGALSRFRAAAGEQIKGEPEAAVEVTGRMMGLSDTEGKGVLRHLLTGGDLSVWGMANAITALANDVKDYDRAVDLERAGGQVIELPPSSWKAIVTAGQN